jgi:hypothetical protein
LLARKFGSWYDVLVRDMVMLRKTSRVCQGLAADGFGEASWKVACRSIHGAPRTNRLKHVVFAAYRRPSIVGETAGIHGFVAVGWMQSMSLMFSLSLLYEYACLYLICPLASCLFKETSPQFLRWTLDHCDFPARLGRWILALVQTISRAGSYP